MEEAQDVQLELPAPLANDRAVYIGPTGSGKTVLARVIECQYPNVIAIDPKHRFSWNLPGERYSRVAHSLRELVLTLKEFEDRRRDWPVIYRPPADDLQPKNVGRVDEVYRFAYERGYTRVYNDDFAAIAMSASATAMLERLPWWFKCSTLGRQRGVGLGASIQRPANVPLVAMSESEYRITFYLRMRNDQKRAEELCGPIDWATLAAQPHSFVWATDIYSSPPMRLQLAPPPEASR